MKELFRILDKKLILKVFVTVLIGVILGTVAFNISTKENEKQIEKRVNFLIIGNDSYSQTTDSIFILSCDPWEDKINMITIPPSSVVSLNGTKTAVSNIYRAGGIQILIDKITEIVPVPIDNYAVLDYQALRHIVDVSGGVKIDVPFDMKYYDSKINYKIDLKKGMQLLDGKKAEMFVRFIPEQNSENINRDHNQKVFLKEFISQKLNADLIKNLPDLFSKISPYVTSDITLSDANKLFSLIEGLNNSKINTISVYGTNQYIDNTLYFVCDYEKNKDILK